MKAGVAAWLLVAASIGVAQARIEEVPFPCGEHYCLWERPVMQAPPTWRFDIERSRTVRINTYAPTDSALTGATLLAYAVTRQKDQSLSDFIHGEQDRLLALSLKLSVYPEPSLPNGDGKSLTVVRIAPRDAGSGLTQWLAFDEESNHFIVFALNAPGALPHDIARRAFASFISAYKM